MIEFFSTTGYGLLGFSLEPCALSLSPLFNLQSAMLKGFSFWDILMADYSGASHQSVRFDDR